jgi:hypothetical protein
MKAKETVPREFVYIQSVYGAVHADQTGDGDRVEGILEIMTCEKSNFLKVPKALESPTSRKIEFSQIPKKMRIQYFHVLQFTIVSATPHFSPSR